MAASSVIPDEGSWPPQLGFLKDLKELMQCPICFDYMQAPVMLPNCDHNYCSLCIRKFFTHREQCPSCGNPASSNQLRSNRLMDETIRNFKNIRQPLLALCLGKGESQTEMLSQTDTDSVGPSQASPKKRLRSNNVSVVSGSDAQENLKETRDNPPTPSHSGANTSSPVHQSVSNSDASDLETVPEVSCSPDKTRKDIFTASSWQKSPLSCPSWEQTSGLKGRTVQSNLLLHLAKAEAGTRSPGGGNQSSAKENMHVRGRQSPSPLPGLSPKPTSPLVALHSHNSSLLKSSAKVTSPLVLSGEKIDLTLEEEPLPSDVTSPSGKALCPVCGASVVSQRINQHLDACLTHQKKRSKTCRLEKKPLPKLVYNLLSDKDLRKRLKELGLNSQGDKQTMIKRHHEFTLYYNADCDSHNPKDKSDLIKEFEDAQKLQIKLASKSSTTKQATLRFTKDAKAEEVTTSLKEYAKQHKSQFQSLIKETKRRMQAERKLRSTSGPSAPAAESSGSSRDDSPKGTQDTSAAGKTSGSRHREVCVVVDDDDDTDSIDIHTEDEGTRADEGQMCAGKSDDGRGSLPKEQTAMSISSPAVHLEVQGIESDTDVFDNDFKPLCGVQRVASVTGKGKRALRPSKPSWKGTDVWETSASPFKPLSHTARGRPSSELRASKATSHGSEQQSERLSDSCLPNPSQHIRNSQSDSSDANQSLLKMSRSPNNVSRNLASPQQGTSSTREKLKRGKDSSRSTSTEQPQSQSDSSRSTELESFKSSASPQPLASESGPTSCAGWSQPCGPEPSQSPCPDAVVMCSSNSPLQNLHESVKNRTDVGMNDKKEQSSSVQSLEDILPNCLSDRVTLMDDGERLEPEPKRQLRSRKRPLKCPRQPLKPKRARCHGDTVSGSLAEPSSFTQVNAGEDGEPRSVSSQRTERNGRGLDTEHSEDHGEDHQTVNSVEDCQEIKGDQHLTDNTAGSFELNLSDYEDQEESVSGVDEGTDRGISKGMSSHGNSNVKQYTAIDTNPDLAEIKERHTSEDMGDMDAAERVENETTDELHISVDVGQMDLAERDENETTGLQTVPGTQQNNSVRTKTSAGQQRQCRDDGVSDSGDLVHTGSPSKGTVLDVCTDPTSSAPAPGMTIEAVVQQGSQATANSAPAPSMSIEAVVQSHATANSVPASCMNIKAVIQQGSQATANSASAPSMNIELEAVTQSQGTANSVPAPSMTMEAVVQRGSQSAASSGPLEAVEAGAAKRKSVPKKQRKSSVRKKTTGPHSGLERQGSDILIDGSTQEGLYNKKEEEHGCTLHSSGAGAPKLSSVHVSEDADVLRDSGETQATKVKSILRAGKNPVLFRKSVRFDKVLARARDLNEALDEGINNLTNDKEAVMQEHTDSSIDAAAAQKLENELETTTHSRKIEEKIKLPSICEDGVFTDTKETNYAPDSVHVDFQETNRGISKQKKQSQQKGGSVLVAKSNKGFAADKERSHDGEGCCTDIISIRSVENLSALTSASDQGVDLPTHEKAQLQNQNQKIGTGDSNTRNIVIAQSEPCTTVSESENKKRRGSKTGKKVTHNTSESQGSMSEEVSSTVQDTITCSKGLSSDESQSTDKSCAVLVQKMHTCSKATESHVSNSIVKSCTVKAQKLHTTGSDLSQSSVESHTVNVQKMHITDSDASKNTIQSCTVDVQKMHTSNKTTESDASKSIVKSCTVDVQKMHTSRKTSESDVLSTVESCTVDVQKMHTCSEVTKSHASQNTVESCTVSQKDRETQHARKGRNTARKRKLSVEEENSEVDVIGSDNVNGKMEMNLSLADIVKTNRRRAKETNKKTTLN